MGARDRGARGPGRGAKGTPQRKATGRAVAPPAVSASRVGYSDSPDPPDRARPDPVAPDPPRPGDACSDPSPRSPTSSPRSTTSLRRGASGGPSRACAPRTPAARAGASSTGPSPRTIRWASTMPGAAPTRTSTSASTRCSARTSATRTASTARACGSRSTSSATSGFTNKRDIEAYGIDRFVTLCKQRVLTYAARQTEQSIRLGMWMDWNDPDELRRLHDLLGTDPSTVTTIEGTDGPVTDTVEMLVGRLGMPEVGGSYFTFSNENNDLIWGFLAEVHRRGWLYKGHDTMPWCARCGTGLSQTEVNEGYQDKDDPGLTVKFPLIDRPGEALLVWTTTPWTLTSNVAAAVGQRLRYVKVRQGDDAFWLAKGTLKTALEGPFQVEEELAGADLVGWRYAGPFDELPAVQAAFAEGYEHRVVPWDEVGEDEGTGIVHIAPGCGAEDFQLAKAIGLPVIAPLDESGIVLEGFGPLSGRDVRDVAEPIIEHLKATDRFYRLETINHRYPHCWRCGTPLIFRLVDEWYISMGPVYDQPRETLSAGPGRREPALPDHGRRRSDPVDPGVRLRPRARLAHEHGRLDDLEEALLGPGAADLRLRGLRARSTSSAGARSSRRARSRAGSGSRATRRIAPGWTRCVSPARGAAPRSSASRMSAIRGWMPASCRSRRCTTARTPSTGRSGSRPTSSPRASRGSSATGSTRCSRCRRSCAARSRSRRSSATPRSSPRTAGRCTRAAGNAIEFDEAAERMGVDVMRWMFTKARPEENILFGWHAADEARRELLILWNVYSFFVTYARLAGWTPKAGIDDVIAAAPAWPAMDRWILSRAAGLADEVGDGPAAITTRSMRRARSARSSTTSRPGSCAARATGCAPARIRPTAMPRSRPSMRPSSPSRERSRRSCPFLVRDDVPEPHGHGRAGHARQRPSHRRGRPTTWRRTATPTWSARWRRSAARSISPARSGRRLACAPASHSREPGSPCRIAASPSPTSCCKPVRRRGQRAGGRAHRRRLRARRASREAAAPEDRQATGRGHPGGHGGGARRSGRVRARTAR